MLALAAKFKAVDVLYSCTTSEQISETFSRYEIMSFEDKTALLHQCMNIEEYFDSPHEELSAEDEYEYAVSVFLEGSWRLLASG